MKAVASPPTHYSTHLTPAPLHSSPPHLAHNTDTHAHTHTRTHTHTHARTHAHTATPPPPCPQSYPPRWSPHLRLLRLRQPFPFACFPPRCRPLKRQIGRQHHKGLCWPGSPPALAGRRGGSGRSRCAGQGRYGQRGVEVARGQPGERGGGGGWRGRGRGEDLVVLVYKWSGS